MPSESPQPLDYATPPARSDPVCVTAIVFATVGILVPFLCVIGLTLSILALRRAKRFGSTSRRRAEIAQTVSLLGLLSTCLVTGWLYNEIHQGRRAAGRVYCAANMREIGMACLLYANANKARFPPDVAILLSTIDLTPKTCVCPTGDSSPAKVAFTSDPAARAAKNLDYIYVGEGLTSSVNPDEPILFERLSDHDHDGGNVLFGDGHVEFYSKSQILKLLEPLRNTPRLTEEEYDSIVAK